MATNSILQRFVDANQWEAEDSFVGRLGMVMHAAFLFAGFQPYGAQPTSGCLLKQSSPVDKKGLATVCLCRWYTAPHHQLAHRCNSNGNGNGAEAAVLMLCARGSDIALLVFLVTADGDLRKLYREHLDQATVAPLLSGALGDTEPRGSRICRKLSDDVCWPLLVDLCYRNGLPLSSSMFSPVDATGLLSMPDDIKVEILKKLTDGEDLARVACVSRELKQVVAGCDAELWKPIYEALTVRRRRRSTLWPHPWFFLESLVALSWKEKYVEARPLPWRSICRRFLCHYSPKIIESPEISSPLLFSLFADPPEPETAATRGEEYTTGGHRSKRERNYYKKGKAHGAGVIHSPSSRNRWKHR